MGEQRRYARQLTERAIARQRLEVMAAGRPDGLREWEVDLEHEALTTPPAPVPVVAHVVYAGTHLRVDGEISRWTSRAVEVSWSSTGEPNGSRHRAWLWRGAVVPRHNDEKPPRPAQ